MTIAAGFLTDYEREMRNARRMLERVSDELFGYRPHRKSMTTGELAGHIAEMSDWGTRTANVDELDYDPPGGPAYKPFVPDSRANLLEFFDWALAESKVAIARVRDEDMHADWTLLERGKLLFTMPRIAVLTSMLLHHVIHHRAQLGVHLRMNDVAIPGMYGPSADDS